MAERPDDVIQHQLRHVLDNDREIRSGIQKAEADERDLFSSVLSRRSEIESACLTELKQLNLSAMELQGAEEVIAARWEKAPRYEIVIRAVFGTAMSLAIILYGCIGIFYGILSHEQLGPIWDTTRGALMLVIITTASLGLVVLLLRFRRGKLAERARTASTFQFLRDNVKTARANWINAVGDNGVKPLLREEINARLPTFVNHIDVQRANGLSEVRDPLYLVDTDAKAQIQELLDSMPSGSIGLAGPRGAGKTTLLRYFCSRDFRPLSEEDDAVRVTLAAPVRYDAREFVIHLFANVCRELAPEVGKYGSPFDAALNQFDETRAFFTSLIRLLLPLSLAWGLIQLAAVIADWKINPGLQSAVLLIVLSASGLSALIYTRAARRRLWRVELSLGREYHSSPSQIEMMAENLLVGLSYQQSVAHGWSAALKPPVGFEATSSSNVTMTERPMSLPEIVSRLADFLRQLSGHKKVFIGIDELDKIESAEDAQRFLNDIKSIFGLEGCYYIVSVSDNAMSAFERRGLPLRDAFDSAFDAIVATPYLDLVESRRLIRRRVIGMPEPFIGFCHALSGGLPRDLIRAARSVVNLSKKKGQDRDLGSVTAGVIATDINRKFLAARTAAQEIALEPSVGIFLSTLPRGVVDARDVASVLRGRRSLLIESTTASPSGLGSEPSAGDAWQALTRLRIELAAYLYFAETIARFFDGPIDRDRLEWIAGGSHYSAPDRLARARMAFSVNPRLAWELTSDFNHDYDLPSSPFPVGIWRQRS
ncbi:hypothetical protein [Micromonospora inositola]|uniref:hypothetical protein n=1 Tax=Micromonospora inositola TaxID=47865 RepID=UPI0012FDF641|nr:hypothetical protein [Micromonospora inositola]